MESKLEENKESKLKLKRDLMGIEVEERGNGRSMNVPMLEEYKKLVNFISFHLPNNRHFILSVSSALPGEGVTFVCVNLSKAMAQAVMSNVLLLDLNVFKPAVHKYFNQTLSPGLIEFMENKTTFEDILRGTSIPNFFIITAGFASTNSSKLLRAQKMNSFLEELRKEFGYIILDCPPLLVNADASILNSYADGNLLVVKAGLTPFEQINKGISLLKDKEKIMGIVLNRAESFIPRWLSRFFK